jgi:hypothetical protein
MTTVLAEPKKSKKAPEQLEFKVKDLSLAEWGRKEILLAEQEMPGLMSLRAEYSAKKPLAGLRIMGSLHMTIQTAVLLQYLQHAGSRRRRDSGGAQGHRAESQGRPRVRLEGRNA